MKRASVLGAALLLCGLAAFGQTATLGVEQLTTQTFTGGFGAWSHTNGWTLSSGTAAKAKVGQ